jgi:hypothetical protein
MMDVDLVLSIAGCVALCLVVGVGLCAGVYVLSETLGARRNRGTSPAGRNPEVIADVPVRNVARVPDPVAVPAVVDEGVIFSSPLDPDVEIFTPVPLRSGAPYIVLLQGTYAWEGRSGGSGGVRGDGHYAAEQCGNFLAPLEQPAGLYLNRRRVRPREEDRHVHTYLFAHRGGGEKLSLRFQTMNGSARTALTEWNLHVTVAACTPLGVAHVKEIAKTLPPPSRTVGRVARLDRGRRETMAERERQIRTLVGRFAFMTTYERPEFIEQYAAVHAEMLLRQREQLLTACAELHRDPELVALLQTEHPETYRRVTWLFRALNQAEWVHVSAAFAEREGRVAGLSDRAAPEPDVSASETERARKVREVHDRAEDTIATTAARVKAVIAASKQMRTTLATEAADLCADDRELLETEVNTLINTLLNRKSAGGTASGHKRL